MWTAVGIPKRAFWLTEIRETPMHTRPARLNLKLEFGTSFVVFLCVPFFPPRFVHFRRTQRWITVFSQIKIIIFNYMGNVVKLENEKQNKAERNQVEIENIYEGFVFQFLRAVFRFFRLLACLRCCCCCCWFCDCFWLTIYLLVWQLLHKCTSKCAECLCVRVFAIFVCSCSIQFKIDDNWLFFSRAKLNRTQEEHFTLFKTRNVYA